MRNGFDLAILGSGFGGALLAMVARRLGRSVILLERGTHPRFAIGESTSPLTNLLLEELALKYDLPRLLPLAAFGTWKKAYPELAVGLKRGFTFYGHRAGESISGVPERDRTLMVAASPNDEVADTHWYRAEFDHFLVREAQSLGCEYVDRVRIDRLTRAADWSELEGTREGRMVSYRARFVVDASGPRGALSRLLELPEEPMPHLPGTQALFTHFTGVQRFEELTLPIEGAPYRPDDAALHHVFDGGWIWVLRFDNGITSAGVAMEERLAAELRPEEREAAWHRLMERLPAVREQFAEAEAVLPWIHAARLSYRCRRVTGPGWALLPSAAAFVDPLFSTGFPLTLLGIHRLGEVLQHAPTGWGDAETLERLDRYAVRTRDEAEAAALLVGGCYAAFDRLPDFAALSMLYFVAASYSEMARRLGRPDLASAFLLQSRPDFRDAFRRHLLASLQGRGVRPEEVARDVEPFNIAGLAEPAKRNVYGVDLQDVVRGAAKLETTPDAVRELIARMGW